MSSSLQAPLSRLPSGYVMFDQTRDKVARIMGERAASDLVARPSWLALGLLVVAFNIIAATSA